MAYMTSIIDLLAVVLFLAIIRSIHDKRRRGGLPYPPGPRPLPIIGNLLDIPKQSSWLAYTRFSQTHGNVLSFRIFGKVIVVLNTAKAANDLLGKRSAIYSDRPVIPIYEMMGWDWVLPTARGDERWRMGRKLLDRDLRPTATASYRPIIQARTHVLLSRLLDSPHRWVSHIELLQGELILAMTYGYQVHGCDDKFLGDAKNRNKFATAKILPGSLLINHIPLLRFIPEWLPWLSYKPLVRTGHDLGNQVLYPPMQFVRESMLNGTAVPSLALENLQEVENLKLSRADRDKTEKIISGALASLYSAGLDTTVSAMKSLFVAMLLYPDIQKKAQDELDSVIGRDRLPTFEDRPRLPFVDAVCQEALRWRPAVPLGVPHAVTEDDVYEGLFIPKGAVVIGNTWAILRDPTIYPEPDVFKPDRFLNSDGSLRDDPTLISAFGFGKRICPGRHFVDMTLFISVASLFSVFNIERGGDAGGNLSDYTYTGGLVSFPKPFPCSFIPRDKRSRELILVHNMAR